ncbi:hypothetical protein [Serinicoccus sediminis]|uniref:hypothetical protein n=1 Tax=Serinicoccus sediminis TaxID=2306021 RepID=UPI00101EF4D0|nr:hypothetical protein [Serinicoccus sediminis]
MSTQPEQEPTGPRHITAAQMTTFLLYPEDDPVSPEAAAVHEGVALGWLSDAADVEPGFDWSSTIEADPSVAGWLLELASISYDNPTSQQASESGDTSSQWRDRRTQILARVQAWAIRRGVAAATTTVRPKSRGKFRPAPSWPYPGTRW